MYERRYKAFFVEVGWQLLGYILACGGFYLLGQWVSKKWLKNKQSQLQKKNN